MSKVWFLLRVVLLFALVLVVSGGIGLLLLFWILEGME